ncbi:MAG: hypothetical protein VST71_05210 [Nitrospirota bacterium]|nr:hypothetical protein [Nitrospirota bacterium]
MFVYLFNAEEEYRFMNHRFNEHDLDSAVQSIVSRKEDINARGMEYIFIAIPAKQTIYGSNIDEFTKNYINLLTDRLQNEGVKTINLVGIFRANKSSGIYNNYDTHWNSKGVGIAVSVISEYLIRTYSGITKRSKLCENCHFEP